jgi:hypothetical protein
MIIFLKLALKSMLFFLKIIVKIPNLNIFYPRKGQGLHCMNPKIIRLKHKQEKQYSNGKLNFNPKIVRLKLDGEGNPVHKNDRPNKILTTTFSKENNKL